MFPSRPSPPGYVDIPCLSSVLCVRVCVDVSCKCVYVYVRVYTCYMYVDMRV